MTKSGGLQLGVNIYKSHKDAQIYYKQCIIDYKHIKAYIKLEGTSLMAQWLSLHAPKAASLGSIPGQGTRSHMLQLRVYMLQLMFLHASMKF